MEIIVLPYLPLRAAVVIGGWRLVPAHRTDSESIVSDDIRAQAQGLLNLYGAGARARIAGAFAAPPDGRLGDDVAHDELLTLRRAIVVGLLEGNPTPPMLVC